MNARSPDRPAAARGSGNASGRHPAVGSTLAVLLAVAFLTSCKTQRTITHKGSRYTINTGEDDDTDEIRAKFGTTFQDAFGDDPYGSDAKRSALEGEMFGDADGEITGSEFRGAREFGEMKEYRTPEYLRRQELSEVDSIAREAGRGVSDDEQAFRESDLTFRGGDEELTFWQRLNPFRRRDQPAREADRVFDAQDYEAGNRAQVEAPSPVPMATVGEGPGDYRDEGSMSMDDVKKLLAPEAYR